MSLGIKVKSKMIKDTFYTLAPVNCVLRIFVLSSVKRQRNELVKYWSLTGNLITLSVMLMINVFFLINKVQRFVGHKAKDSIRFTDSLQLTYLLSYSEYIVDLFCVYQARSTFLKYIQFYSSIDKILGIPNFKRIRSKNLITTISIIISFIISSTIDYISWFMWYGWIPPTLYSLDYIYLFINAITVLDVISNVIQIEYRLKVMIRVIEDFYASFLSHSGSEVLNEQAFESVIDRKRMDRLRAVSSETNFGILSLSKCYVLLLEQVSYINYAYGVRIGAFCLNILINLIHLTNIIIRVSIGKLMTTYSACYLPAVSTTLRIINYAAVLHILVYRCEQTYRQCRSIVRMIDLIVVNNKFPDDQKTALMDLRSLVLSRPIQFHGANFFILDYPLLVSVASIIVTYTIILLQSMQ